MGLTKFTKNTATSGIEFIESGQSKDQNIQAVCEAVSGKTGTEGRATWTAAASLAVSDTRVTANSRILLCGAETKQPVGFWYVSSKGDGTFTITSTDVEQAGCIVNYLVVNNS